MTWMLGAIGLVTNLVGLGLMYWYGMPPKGPRGIVSSNLDEKEAALERGRQYMGWIGFGQAVLGTALLAFAWLSTEGIINGQGT